MQENQTPQPQATAKPVRIGVFGWGIVAPKSPNVRAFETNLDTADSWLTPFRGFGPANFLAGEPEFNFDDYRPWINARFAPRHFQTLKEKMDPTTLYALGAFIQSLEQNPGLEAELKELGSQARVYVAPGLGALGTIADASIELYEAQNGWDRFWSRPERNSALRDCGGDQPGAPARPESVPESGRPAAERAWNRYWMEQSGELREFLAELAEIEDLSIAGDIASGKLNAIREKEKRRAKLFEKWGAPEPPWKVSANVIWNLHNTPAAQISILAKITGLAFAPVAACSTFNVALKLAMDAIRSGEAKVVVVGASDPPPMGLTVGAFYSGRVLASGAGVSVPLSRMLGTHVAGGSAIWIVGDMEYLKAKGYQPIGMEPVAVGASSDAFHIITPSPEGPRAAIRQALDLAGGTPDDLSTWDLHATATPGDLSEMTAMRSIAPGSVVVTARKGTFGHGMGAGGGWELTAQYLGQQRGKLFPTPLREADLAPSIAALGSHVVFDQPCEAGSGLAGKLSMGIGGINACVISRPLE